MSTINSITVGGVISEVRPPRNPNGATGITVQTPITKNDGKPGDKFTKFEVFGNTTHYTVGSAVLINGTYRQSTLKDNDGNNIDFRSLVANRVQFTGSKEKPVVFPILEAEISGNISSEVSLYTNGVAKYSVALNSYKKAEQPNQQPTVTTYFVSVTDFTGSSNGFQKGQPVYLKGMFNHGNFTKQSGEKVYTLDFIVSTAIASIPAFAPQTKQTNSQQNMQGQSQAAPQQNMQVKPQAAPQQNMSIPADFGQPQNTPQDVPQDSAMNGFMSADLDSFFDAWN